MLPGRFLFDVCPISPYMVCLGVSSDGLGRPGVIRSCTVNVQIDP